MRFPSIEWFAAVKAAADGRVDEFKTLGFCDATVRVVVQTSSGDEDFVLFFEDYGCRDVVVGDDTSAEDFTIAADLEVWRSMLESIREEGTPSLGLSLASLQLPGKLELRARSQEHEDLFFRYNQSFQEFFNSSRDVATEFAAPSQEGTSG